MLNEKMDGIIRKYLEDHLDEMTVMLQEMTRIPSLTSEPAEGAPYGLELRRMLDYALDACAKAGLKTRDIDGYAGDATWGDNDRPSVATLSHLDVVPPGEGWTMDPFCGTFKDGKVYGRGSNDNKVAFVEVLYAIQALKEAGFTPDRPIRMIFGCDEESGMSDMAYYVKHADIPELAFSPDSGFPLTYAEKCLMSGSVRINYDGKTAIRSIVCGTRTNVVPVSAKAIVDLPLETFPAADRITCTPNEDGTVLIEAKGIAAHAAWAQGGLNAFGLLMQYLDKYLPEDDAARKLTGFYVRHIGMETDGASLGVACTDDVAGPLTHNVGVANGDDTFCRFDFDIRQPVLCDPEITVGTLRKLYEENGFEVLDISYKPALYMPKDHPLVVTLMKVYRELTGDMSEPVAMGGGTYARSLPCAVAFGPSMEGTSFGAHQADEWALVSHMPVAARIFAHALAELSCVELP